MAAEVTSVNNFVLIANPSAAEWTKAGLIFAVAIATFLVLRISRDWLVKKLDLQDYVVDTIRRVIITLIAALAALYILDIFDVQLGPVIGGLGVSGIIAAVALQPVFGNLVGSALLHSSKGFRPGDQIETNGIIGTVVDINHRSVELIDFNGMTNYIPNLKVLDSPFRNQTAEQIRRSTLEFQVSYDDDLRETQRVISQALRQVDGVVDVPTADVVVNGFATSGVDLEARVWHPSEELSARWIVSEAAITIRETLAAHDITIPYPHLVVQNKDGS